MDPINARHSILCVGFDTLLCGSHLQPEVVYSVHLELTGSVYDIGVEGKTSLTGPGGVTFSLPETGLVESDPHSGPVAKFLYAP